MVHAQAQDHSDRKSLATDWAELLAPVVKRGPEEIRSRGLSANDFNVYDYIVVNFCDHSNAKFWFAFYVVDEEKDLVAVFTEHCGYFVFRASSVQVIGVKNETWTGKHFD